MAGDRLERLFGEVGRMAREEAHAAHAVDLGDAADQLGEARLGMTVGGDVLSEQGDLDATHLHHALDFADHDVGMLVTQHATRRRHDAEGAAIVAALGDRDEVAVVRRRRLWLGLVGDRAVDLEIELGRAGAKVLFDEIGQASVVVGADDEIDGLALGVEFFAQALRHAAEHADPHFGPAVLVLLQFADATQDARLGVVADRAGVEQEKVGVLGSIDFAPARAAQTVTHRVAVVHVHLTPVGLDVHAARGREGGIVFGHAADVSPAGASSPHSRPWASTCVAQTAIVRRLGAGLRTSQTLA